MTDPFLPIIRAPCLLFSHFAARDLEFGKSLLGGWFSKRLPVFCSIRCELQVVGALRSKRIPSNVVDNMLRRGMSVNFNRTAVMPTRKKRRIGLFVIIIMIVFSDVQMILDMIKMDKGDWN